MSYARGRRIRETVLVVGATLIASLGAGTTGAWAATRDFDGDGVSAPADCAPLDPAVYPGAVDTPDMAFEDTNCDGIDGDLAKAVFVAPTGSDSNSGTLASPKKTIKAAIIAAAAASKDVYVDGGTYLESVSLVSGVSIYGGYVPGTGARSADTPTIVRGAPAALASGAERVTLQLLTLEGQPDADGNAYGLRAISASGTRSRLLLDHVTARGLAAAAGTAGTGGSQGASGYLGFGANGSGCNGGGGGTGGPGGNGGAAGNSGNGSGYLGGPGTAGTSVGGAAGGLRGRDTAYGNGGTGGAGDPGGTGANNPAHPAYDLATWVRPVGALGGNGGAGAGGGGGIGGSGASSGFYDFCGGAGGGGGVGGGGGTAGSGGQAGGGSFGAYLFDSSVVASGSQFVAGTGGAGGNGGTGGDGGSGGSGGVGNYGSYVFSDFWPTAHSGDGGFGGNGGYGGKGGGGGAGAGGPAVGLLQASSGSGYAAQQGTTETAGSRRRRRQAGQQRSRGCRRPVRRNPALGCGAQHVEGGLRRGRRCRPRRRLPRGGRAQQRRRLPQAPGQADRS